MSLLIPSRPPLSRSPSRTVSRSHSRSLNRSLSRSHSRSLGRSRGRLSVKPVQIIINGMRNLRKSMHRATVRKISKDTDNRNLDDFLEEHPTVDGMIFFGDLEYDYEKMMKEPKFNDISNDKKMAIQKLLYIQRTSKKMSDKYKNIYTTAMRNIANVYLQTPEYADTRVNNMLSSLKDGADKEIFEHIQKNLPGLKTPMTKTSMTIVPSHSSPKGGKRHKTRKLR